MSKEFLSIDYRALLETCETPEQESLLQGYLVFECIKLWFPEVPLSQFQKTH